MLSKFTSRLLLKSQNQQVYRCFAQKPSFRTKTNSMVASEFDEGQAKTIFYEQRKEFHKEIIRSRKLNPSLLSVSYMTAICGGIMSVATLKLTGTLYPIVFLAPIIYHVRFPYPQYQMIYFLDKHEHGHSHERIRFD